MSGSMIPRTIDDITPEWLSTALGRTVTSVKTEPIGVGVGLVGQLFRLQLDGGGGSSTVIAKLAALTEEDRFVATVLNMYGREVAFYTELSPRTTIAHPECYFAAHDPVTQDCVLLLEDVSTRGRGGDQVVGCSLDDAESAIRTLARLHACYWDDASLPASVAKLSDDPYPAAVAMAYDVAWPRVEELFGDMIDDRVRAFGDGYSARIPGLFAKLCDGPLVLSHADWRLDNLFFTDNADGDVIAIDWQLIDRSVGPRDLSYHVTQSVNIDDPAGYVRAFDTYVGALAELGVAVDRDWAWEMYRYGTMLGFVYPVIAAGAITIANDRSIELTRALFRRSLAALDALDAFALSL